MLKIVPTFYLLIRLIHSILAFQSSIDSNNCDFLGDVDHLDGLQCGYLEVSENHQELDSRKIKIAYVIIKARNPSSDSYPMMYLASGPGNSTLTPGDLNAWHNSDLRENRDLILFDQRGVHHSSPLPNMAGELSEIIPLDITIDKELELIRNILNRYSQKAIDLGINLGYYNSIQSAQDVGALMEHLGYERYNLYGNSYGSRLARVVQDMFPEKINSVIINAPSILDGDFLISRLTDYSSNLQNIFDYCEQDEACNKRYPNLTSDYIQLVSDLKSNPISVNSDIERFVINSQDAMKMIRGLLYSTNSRKYVPILIQALKNRESTLIKDFLPPKPKADGSHNVTMWLAVERYEQFDPKNTTEVIDSIYLTLPLLPERSGEITSLYLAAQEWPFPYLPGQERSFKTSDIPTIIFVNRYDPVTPPENGIIMQKDLTQSKLFILDDWGHSASDWECRVKVMNDFMDDKLKPLDTGCLNLYSAED